MTWVPPVMMAGHVLTNLLNAVLSRRGKGGPESNSAEVVKEMQSFRKENERLVEKFLEIQQSMKEQKLTTYDDLVKHDKKKAEALVNVANETVKHELPGINIGFFGLTSTGKSTIINSMIGKKVAQVGYGEVTIDAKSYPSENRNYTLWDMPGKNDDLSYFTLEFISYWKGLTRRIIIIQYTVKEMSSITQLLDAIDLRYDLVINKLDQIEELEREAFKKQIQKEVKECNLKNVDNIWFISAKNVQQFDWLQMINNLVPLKR